MKSFTLFLLLLLCSFTASAQAGYDSLLNKCIEKMPPGFTYKRGYYMKYCKSCRHYEFSAILLKNTEYVIRVADAANSPSPFAVGVNLHDHKHQSVVPELDSLPQQGFRFVCRQTGLYVFSFYYKRYDDHPDAAAVLAFRLILPGNPD